MRLIGEDGSVELVADLQQLPLFHVSHGAPPLLLRSLIFRGGTTQPIIVIEGGDVTLEGCTFVDNAASAVEIRGGRLLVRGSNFANNRGQGAISARGDAQVTIESSSFVGNNANDGGALNAAGAARVTVMSTLFERNNATTNGGALSVTGLARIALGNQTLLSDNNAPNGRTAFFRGGRQAIYVLPTPIAHWLSNTEECKESDELCSIGSNITRLVDGALDDKFYPFECAPGLLGDSLNFSAQNSPQCNGVCPGGFFCRAATGGFASESPPVQCPNGTYCAPGSSAPTPCDAGKYGEPYYPEDAMTPSPLRDEDDCKICERGYWCRGGFQNPCPLGTYNDREGMSDVDSCSQCTEHSTTEAVGTVSAERCICEAGYYDRRSISGSATPVCERCRLGMGCGDDVGISLETIPLMRGYYRRSATSEDVHICMDAHVNCTGQRSGVTVVQCPESSSGCRGGSDPSRVCMPGLEGPFCRLCANGTTGSIEPSSGELSSGENDGDDNSHMIAFGQRTYYVSASKEQPAHCKRCAGYARRVHSSERRRRRRHRPTTRVALLHNKQSFDKGMRHGDHQLQQQVHATQQAEDHDRLLSDRGEGGQDLSD